MLTDTLFVIMGFHNKVLLSLTQHRSILVLNSTEHFLTSKKHLEVIKDKLKTRNTIISKLVGTS